MEIVTSHISAFKTSDILWVVGRGGFLMQGPGQLQTCCCFEKPNKVIELFSNLLFKICLNYKIKPLDQSLIHLFACCWQTWNKGLKRNDRQTPRTCSWHTCRNTAVWKTTQLMVDIWCNSSGLKIWKIKLLTQLF